MALLPVFLFSINGIGSSTITELLCSFGFIFGLALLPIFYGLTNKLVTTQFGIENYFFYPFHVLVPWDKLIRVQIGPFGNVFLIAQQKSSKSVLNVFSQTIQLDSYISNWKDNEFIQDLQQFAPQVSIPDELLHKETVRFPYRTGTFLLYFLACIVFMLVPSILIPKDIIQPIKFAWGFAVFGLLGGALGGMAELLQYSVWLSSKPDETAMKKVARLLYLTPFSAWLMVFIVGTLFHMATGYEVSKDMQGSVNLASLFIGFVQFKILQRVF
ncbi:MAG TPA: hypothetical protein PLT08_18715 [Anaerolineales bacterium]|nr:hypothetical protein [Anaerolineales bacterium]